MGSNNEMKKAYPFFMQIENETVMNNTIKNIVTKTTPCGKKPTMP